MTALSYYTSRVCKIIDAIKITLIILFFISITYSISAQEKTNTKKGKLETGIGVNFIGPSKQMADLMVKYHFNASSNIFGLHLKHPHYQKEGITGYVSYSCYIGLHSQLGVQVSYSAFSQVMGYSASATFLFVRLRNISLIPFYIFELKKYLEFQTGPALMMNSGNKTSQKGNIPEKYTKLSAGLLTGINFKLWDKKITFAKVGINYLFALKNKTGPFTASFLENLADIPESKIRYSYLCIALSFGIKL